jgi:hypothetical protein
MRSWKSATSTGLALVLAGVLCVPVWAQANPYPPQGPQQGPRQAQAGPPQGPPAGMLNYVEGQASIGGQALSEKSAGSMELQPGQTLATQNGRAELLLTPGVIMRMDNNSAVLMNNAGLADTDVAVQSGRAMVEADQVLPANHIDIREGPATVRLVTHGLYDFDAAHGVVRVFDGRAEVTVAGKAHTLQAGHQFDLNAAKLSAKGFDKKASENADAFYRWSSLRSSYLAEANADAARGFAQGYYGPGSAYGAGYGYAAYGPAYGPYGDPGWFWDPYFDAYTWLPWDGVFFSPFGWGFYSPGFAYAAPFYGYGFRGGYHNFGPGYHPMVAAHVGGSGQIAGNGFHGGGFAGGGAAYSGGGFHGGGGFGGGGFHGGGFGGGGGGRR